MTFKMAPSPDPASQILEFLPQRLKRWETQYLDNAFSKEVKLSSYVIADTIRTSARFLPMLFGSPSP
jgi:hypothetical protein